MSDTITFKKPTTFKGRNGTFKCSAVQVWVARKDSRATGLSQTMYIEPITTRGNLGNCHICLPVEQAHEVATAIALAAVAEGVPAPDRHTLATGIYNLVVENTESMTGTIGPDLAYLLGAILKDGLCEWNHTRPIVRLLRKHCPHDHPVWGHIAIDVPQEGVAP